MKKLQKEKYKSFPSQSEKRKDMPRWRLLRLLRNQWKFWPSIEVARASGYSQHYISFLRREFYLQLVHNEEAMADPVYRVWYEDKERKRLLNLKKFYGKPL
jgi:hypothetical protein